MNTVDMLVEWESALGAQSVDHPSNPGFDTVRLRLALLKEEFDEYEEAARSGDLVGVADGLADMVYVIYGTALAYGIDLDAVIAEVHRSNMTKIPPNGNILRRWDGKILKPPTYEPPNIARVLALDATDGGAE